MRQISRSREFMAKDVPYVPDIEANILSVSHLVKRGLVLTFLGSEAIISRNEEVVVVAYLEDGLYQMKESTTSSRCSTSS